MTRICRSCPAEFHTTSLLAMDCPTCRHKREGARQRAARRKDLMKNAATVFAVAGAGFADHSPMINAAMADWELRTVYSQAHPCGVSERN